MKRFAFAIELTLLLIVLLALLLITSAAKSAEVPPVVRIATVTTFVEGKRLGSGVSNIVEWQGFVDAGPAS